MDFFEKLLDALLVHSFGGFQHVEIHTHGRGEMDESLHVFRKAETSETQAGFQELRADARVEPHGVRDFLDVGANSFAEVGDDVGVADFQCEKRVGRVLDEFGAVDGGDEKFGLVARRACAVVHRAMKLVIQDGAINFAQFFGGGRIFDANDDAVGVKEIVNGGAFAQEFGIGRDAESNVVTARVGGKGATKLESGARGNGAFFHDQFGRLRLRGDLPGHVIDGGEICFAGLFGRRANANEDGVAGTDGIADVGSVGDFAGLASGG